MLDQTEVRLPEKFMERVLERLSTKCATRSEAIHEAILEVLGRPLNSEERWAIVDQAAKNCPGVKLNREIINRIAGGSRK